MKVFPLSLYIVLRWPYLALSQLHSQKSYHSPTTVSLHTIAILLLVKALYLYIGPVPSWTRPTTLYSALYRWCLGVGSIAYWHVSHTIRPTFNTFTFQPGSDELLPGRTRRKYRTTLVAGVLHLAIQQ